MRYINICLLDFIQI